MRVFRDGDIDVWIKPLAASGGHSRAIAILNRGDHKMVYDLSAKQLGLSPDRKVRDLGQHQDLGQMGESKKFGVEKQGMVVLLVP